MKFFLALLTPIVVMVSANYLVVRLNQDLSLDQDLQLDVYFPSNACERAAENSDQLLNTLEHFLLISNCYHSDSFKRLGNKWRFEHLVPPGIHRKNAYNNGFELGKWLQSKERRGEKWSIEKLNRFEVFNHDNPEYIVHTLHFLCAHPDFTWQLHKPIPINSWQKNQYALLLFSNVVFW